MLQVQALGGQGLCGTILKLQSKRQCTTKVDAPDWYICHLQAAALIVTCHRHLPCLLCVNPQVQTLTDQYQKADHPKKRRAGHALLTSP